MKHLSQDFAPQAVGRQPPLLEQHFAEVPGFAHLVKFDLRRRFGEKIANVIAYLYSFQFDYSK
jgi:hypothetical protein